MFLGSGRSKRRLAKAAGAEPSGHMRDKQLHAIVARSTFRSQNWARKNCQVRSSFGSWDVEKVHIVVAGNTFGSQRGTGTPFLEHFRKLRCWKSARHCGRKHISKSKLWKTVRFGALLEVEMSKKWTSLWQEAHLEVKMVKAYHSWSTFGSCAVEKVHGVVARSTFWSQNCEQLSGLEHFWKLRCGFAWQAQGRKKCAKREGFVADSKALAGVGWAGAVQETHEPDLFGGVGADFLRGVAFWSIRSSSLLRGFCVTGAALRMNWPHFFVAGAILQTNETGKSQNALIRGGQLCRQLSIFEGSLAELRRFFGVVNKLWKLMISHRISSFLRLSSSKIPGILAEVLGFWCCQFKILGKSCRIASFLVQRQKKERWMDGWMDR